MCIKCKRLFLRASHSFKLCDTSSWMDLSLYHLKVIIDKQLRDKILVEAETSDVQSNFDEITLRHGCSLVNLLHIFRTPFPENTYGRLLLIERKKGSLFEIYNMKNCLKQVNLVCSFRR